MTSDDPKVQDRTDDLAWDTISWWLALAVAILGIPSLSFIIVTLTGVEDVMGILVFMVTCWTCTYFGIYLVTHPNMKKKRDFTRDS